MGDKGKTEKVDLYKLHKADYAAPKKPVLLEVAPARYLGIDGEGKPGGEEFQARVGALYGAAFTIKMTRKFAGKGDYAVCKLEGLDEGQCVQMLHLGPFDAERETIAVMRAFMDEEGLTRRGLHHEIYLSDPRRVAPERLRTILRLPVVSR